MLRTCKVNLSDNLAKYISVLFISEYGILVNILSACKRVHPGIYESWVSVSVIFVSVLFSFLLDIHCKKCSCLKPDLPVRLHSKMPLLLHLQCSMRLQNNSVVDLKSKAKEYMPF